jgi:hypothetical protein
MAAVKGYTQTTMIGVDDTVIFCSPLQASDTLVRTGTCAEGSCLYHSVLRASDTRYSSLGFEDRLDMVDDLRKSLAVRVSMREWKALGDGQVARLAFEERISYLLPRVYRYSREGRGGSLPHDIRAYIKKNEELYGVIFDLFPIEKAFEWKIFPAVNLRCRGEDSTIRTYKTILTEESIKYLGTRNELVSLPDNKLHYIKRGLIGFLDTLLDSAESFAYTDYLAKVGDATEHVDQETIALISNRLDRDIYFIDAKTRMPYQNASSPDNIKGRKSVIIAYINDVHYEVVGRLSRSKESDSLGSIQREFDSDDPLIAKIRTFLCHPGRVARKYPDLVRYLPREFQTHRTEYLSSDAYSDSSSPTPSLDGSEIEEY